MANPEPVISLVLPLGTVNFIVSCLGQQPYSNVAVTIEEIKRQAEEDIQKHNAFLAGG